MLSGACTRTTLTLSRARASRCAFPTPNKVHLNLVFDKKSCNTMGNRESKLRAHGQKRATPTTAGDAASRPRGPLGQPLGGTCLSDL